MTILSTDQRAFLVEQSIPLSTVFDATGMSRTQYDLFMKGLGKKVAIGVNPCRKSGHSMRTRKGACMQCNPAAITFLSRYDELGSVYIAGSKTGRLIKVGLSGDTSKREKTLNDVGYGGFMDWRVLYVVDCQDGGRIEFLIHKELEAYNTPRQYIRGSHTVDCLELFQCGYDTAQNAFERVLKGIGLTNLRTAWVSPYVHEYQFEDSLSDGATRKGNTATRDDNGAHQNQPVLNQASSSLTAVTPTDKLPTTDLHQNQPTVNQASSSLTAVEKAYSRKTHGTPERHQTIDQKSGTITDKGLMGNPVSLSTVPQPPVKNDDEMSTLEIFFSFAGCIGLAFIIFSYLFGSSEDPGIINDDSNYRIEVVESITSLKSIITEGGESYYSYSDRSYDEVRKMAERYLESLNPLDINDVAIVAGIWHEGVVHGWCGDGCMSSDDTVSFTPNHSVSYKFAKIAHEGGSGLGTLYLAELYAYSDATPYDPKKTISLYQQAESRGISASQDMIRWGQTMLIDLGQSISADGDFGQNTCAAMQGVYFSHGSDIPECFNYFSREQLLQLEHWRLN